MLPAELHLVPIVFLIPALIVLVISLIVPAYEIVLFDVGLLLSLMGVASYASIVLCFFFEDWKR